MAWKGMGLQVQKLPWKCRYIDAGYFDMLFKICIFCF